MKTLALARLPALLSSHSATALLPQTQQRIPALGTHLLPWIPKPGEVSFLEMGDAPRDAPWAGSQLRSSLVMVALVGCAGNRRAFGSLDQQARRGWERGCPSLSLPPALGEMVHPGNPFLFLQCSCLAARGFGTLSFWYRFLQRMNHPDNYFCLNSCLRTAE